MNKTKTNYKNEILAGITTFCASMYIIIVNPQILSEAGMPFSAVLTATILVSAFSSILMGIYAKNPILIAPGMGLNAFFTYSVVLTLKIPFITALGIVFWSGIVFLILSILNIRTKIINAIPEQLRFGVAVGIGLLISLIGLTKSKFIIANPSTIVGIGAFNECTLTFIAGVIITAILIARKVKGALIFGILATTIFSYPIGRLYGNALLCGYNTEKLVQLKNFFAMPDFSLFFKLDIIGALQFSMIPIIFAFLFTDLFDSLSTFIGIAEAADLKNENNEPKNVKESLIVDSIGTIISGLFGTSPGTSYIESAAGIREGGKTGLTAIIAGVLFLPFMFFSPLLSMIPEIATAPALLMVGVFMMKPVLKIHWENFDDAFPAFLSAILIPLTYSITQGIIFGFLSWTIIKLALGKKNEVSKTLIIIDIFAVFSLYV